MEFLSQLNRCQDFPEVSPGGSKLYCLEKPDANLRSRFSTPPSLFWSIYETVNCGCDSFATIQTSVFVLPSFIFLNFIEV